jgi:propionate CoA-transferase
MKADDILEWYDGGGLDMTCLGAAEIDSKGNVNASCFNGRCVGPGGFVDISQNTKKACFLGTFKASGLKVKVGGGKLEILSEGKITKLKKDVDEITFSAEYAVETGQEVFYITERAVFKAEPEGFTLIEIAPGIDLEKDVLGQMEFAPRVSPNLKLMDERIFKDEKMGLTL